MDMKIVFLSLVSFSLVIPPAFGSLKLAQVLLDTAFDGVELVGDKMADFATNIVNAKTSAIQSIIGAKGDLANSFINIFRKDKGSYVSDESMKDFNENDIQIACDPCDVNTVRVVSSLRAPRINGVVPRFWSNLRRIVREGLRRSSLRTLRRNVHNNRRLVHTVRQDTTEHRMIVSPPVVYEYITAPRFN